MPGMPPPKSATAMCGTGACVAGGMCGRGLVWQGACMAGGVHGRGVMCGRGCA